MQGPAAQNEVSLDDILQDMAPAKSSKAYESVWNDFLTFSCKEDPYQLDEADFMKYFHFLKKSGNQKSSTLWTKYSMLNNVYQRKTGKKLQTLSPRLTLQLKAYQRDYSRKVAAVFTLADFHKFLRLDLPSPYWIVRKAFAAIAWSGGLRCDELHRLTIGSLKKSDDGYVITFSHAKQLLERKENTFLVPFNKADQSICLASKVSTYLQCVDSLALDNGSRLFVGCMGGKAFVKTPMGINMLRNIGKDVACILSLESPMAYTGHCWRRSSATQAATQGATTVDMKRQFGWKQEVTAMRYIDQTYQQQVKMASLTTGQACITRTSVLTNSETAGTEENSSPCGDNVDRAKEYHFHVKHCTLNFN